MRERLARLADLSDRTQSYLAAQAIEEYLAVQEWQLEGIKDAIAAADRGELIPDEKIDAWIESLDTDNELPVPTA